MACKAKTMPNWDELVTRYGGPGFIPHDPISFPHRYRQSSDWRDIECAAFIAAHFSYGRREAILQTLAGIFERLGPEPVFTLVTTSPKDLVSRFKGFYYRFNTADDLIFLLQRLGEIYQNDTQASLKTLWREIHQQTSDVRQSIHRFRHALLAEGNVLAPQTYGMKFLFADPMQNSAAKRFNMFLRWMVRADEVDFGLWADVMSPAQLMMPLDTHVAATARAYGITQRKSNDWQTAEEITRYFRRLYPEDPVRYDFALFGLGIQKASKSAPAS